MTVRELLQKLGTEAIRNNLHENAWVNALMVDYRTTDNWIITDCRFPNEYEYVKKYGGKVIRINRPDVSAVNAHPSETAIDNYDFDGYILNDGSLELLEDSVVSLVDKFLNKNI